MTNRKTAISLGQKTYEGKPCKTCSGTLRSIGSCSCVNCRLKHTKRWRANNKDHIKQYDEKQYLNHKRSGKAKEWNDAWYQRNPQKRATRRFLRIDAQSRAIPKWFEKDDVAMVYRKAKELSVTLSCQMTVDHIIPIQSKTVCGLHCFENLQLMDKPLNQSKGNKYITEW